MSRRILLPLVAVAGLATGVYLAGRPELRPAGSSVSSRRPLASASRAAGPRLAWPPPGAVARSAVVLIGDGLGFAGIEAGRLLERGVGGGLELDRLPVAGFVSTRSARGVGTDSGAAATALATGHKTLIGRVGVDQAGGPLRNLVEAAQAAGKKVGLITDSYLWDATPAGFSVHNERRRNTEEIALAMAAAGIEVLIGCEAKGFAADDPGGKIEERFGAAAYEVTRALPALERALAGEGKVIGLFPAGSLTPQQGESRLARVTALALERLGRSANGFFLLVETEETDTGGHHGDLERVARGVAALDGALAAVLKVAEGDGQTLVVLTADHETGGLVLLGGQIGEPLRHLWATGNHNAEPVPILAYGPGAERFSGSLDNTAVAGGLAAALGLELTAPRP